MGVWNRFKADQGGTTAVIFGLAMLPLVGLVGATVDYSRAANQVSKMQRAADATALALVREPPTLSASEFQARGRRLFASLYTPGNGVVLDDPGIRRDGTVVTVAPTARMTNAFMQVLHVPSTPLKALSTASGSRERIELALVLDNTGSMNETIDGARKIDELKRVAGDLVDQLRGLATDADAVRISVVPFDTEVRLDPNRYRNRDWLRWQNPSSRAERENWTGYVIDRYRPYDAGDALPAMSVRDSLYPVLAQSEWAAYGDLPAVQPLVSLYGRTEYDSVQRTISGMRPRGNTNVGLGVSWGTATLTGSVPLDGAASTDSRKLRRFMVVLTDGTNTQKWVNGQKLLPTTTGLLDPILRLFNDSARSACETAKDPKGANIEVFTIRLLDGDANLLSACASPPNERSSRHYFNVQSKTDLEGAFRSILESVGQMRITS